MRACHSESSLQDNQYNAVGYSALSRPILLLAILRRTGLSERHVMMNRTDMWTTMSVPAQQHDNRVGFGGNKSKQKHVAAAAIVALQK